MFKVYGDPTGSKTLNMNDSGNMKHYETRLSYLCSLGGGGGRGVASLRGIKSYHFEFKF